MTPTNKLRWVKREIKATHPAMNALSPKQYETVFQQLLEGYPPHTFINYADPAAAYYAINNPPKEWRDIPVETEEQK